MNIFKIIVARDHRLGSILLQAVLVLILAAGCGHLPHSSILLFITFPVLVGWYFNSNEVHRLLLIPLWIIVSFAVGAAIS